MGLCCALITTAELVNISATPEFLFLVWVLNNTEDLLSENFMYLSLLILFLSDYHSHYIAYKANIYPGTW